MTVEPSSISERDGRQTRLKSKAKAQSALSLRPSHASEKVDDNHHHMHHSSLLTTQKFQGHLAKAQKEDKERESENFVLSAK